VGGEVVTASIDSFVNRLAEGVVHPLDTFLQRPPWKRRNFVKEEEAATFDGR
jgi:hypothetical protein